MESENNILNIHCKKFSEQIKAMQFEEIHKILSDIAKSNYDNYIKSIISIETGISDIATLDNFYHKFMDDDNISLINEDLF